MLNLYSALLVFATFKALLQHNTEFIHLLAAETVKQGTTFSLGEINLTIIIIYISHLDRLQKKGKILLAMSKRNTSSDTCTAH